PTSVTTIDCNDANASMHPRLPELCNGIDDDCSGAPETAAEGATACTVSNAYSICRTTSAPAATGCYTVACIDGYADCDSTRGCETNTLTDRNNCGACGSVCAPGASCINGVCDGVRTLAVGSSHGCALRRSGTVACWGLGTSGQLGNGAMTNS